MSRKGENIYKRKDGRWEGRYIKSRCPSGKANYGYVYAKSYREAKAKLADAKVSHISASAFAQQSSSEFFSDIATDWISKAKPTVKESTSNKYQNLLDSYILPKLGGVQVCNLTHEMIDSYCSELLLAGGVKKIGLSPKTVSDTLSVIRNVLQYAAMEGTVVPCDAKSIRIKRQINGMRVLSRCEQEKLCKYLYSDLNSYNIGILLCLFSGLRIGELCALQWEDISFDEHTIHVSKTMQRVQNKSSSSPKTRILVTAPKSPCSIRTIPIPDDLVKILLSYKKTSTGFVLSNSEKRFVEPRTMQNRYKRALNKSSIDSANFHSLRHTFATRCIELGFDVKSLSEILGHASVNITMNRYVHPSMELKKENMQKLSELLAVK